MSRSLLHATKLDLFKAWLDIEGIEHRPGRGEYEVLQIKQNGKDWYCIFKRDGVLTHYTNDRRLDTLVERFISKYRQSR